MRSAPNRRHLHIAVTRKTPASCFGQAPGSFLKCFNHLRIQLNALPVLTIFDHVNARTNITVVDLSVNRVRIISLIDMLDNGWSDIVIFPHNFLAVRLTSHISVAVTAQKVQLIAVVTLLQAAADSGGNITPLVMKPLLNFLEGCRRDVTLRERFLPLADDFICQRP